MGGLARRYLRPSNVFLLRVISRITRSPSRTSIPCRRESPPLVRCSTSHSVRMRTQRKPAASKADPISDRSLRLDTYTCFFIVSVVEVIVFVRRRVERRKFAVSFPFPDGMAPLRKIPRPADGLPPRCLAVVLYTRRGKRDAEISLFSLVQVLFSISILIYKYLSMSVQHLSLTNRSTELIYMHSLYIVFGAVFPH